ncbi:MAG: GNAT family N-acetyltransferase [Nanobdellota archaeon]
MTDKQKIIDPVDKSLLEKEINDSTFCRMSSRNNDKELHILDPLKHDLSYSLGEIGRLREHSFRAVGGGTGQSSDVDHFDYDPEHPYKQLIVWDPAEKEILGGYRFINGKDVPKEHAQDFLASGIVFNLANTFKDKYLHDIIELGRSWVHPDYIIKHGEKGLGSFMLNNLFDGLSTLIVDEKPKYFFGKVTLYPSEDMAYFHQRNAMMNILSKHRSLEDKRPLLFAKQTVDNPPDAEKFRRISNPENSFTEDYLRYRKITEKEGHDYMPPLLHTYLKISDDLKYLGIGQNEGFGNTEEVAILVPVDSVKPKYINKRIETYLAEKQQRDSR